VSLLARVSRILSERGIAHAVIGAAALAAHGVPRATADLDLLAFDPACLDPSLWEGLRAAGVEVQVRRGDEVDPLAGVVRMAMKGEGPVDLIVGRELWQREILGRARAYRIGEGPVPVVTAPDLVLLKLYAGGPQDAWDIDQLLDADPSLRAGVEMRLDALPAECAALWRRIVAQKRDGAR
jgi:hypothetical protein